MRNLGGRLIGDDIHDICESGARTGRGVPAQLHQIVHKVRAAIRAI